MKDILIREVPPALHKALRIRAAEENKSMSDIIKGILDDVLGDNRKVDTPEFQTKSGEGEKINQE